MNGSRPLIYARLDGRDIQCHPQSGVGIYVLGRWRFRLRGRAGRAGSSTDRQLELEDRASGGARRHPDLSVVAFDDRMADRKSHPHTALFGRKERLEDFIKFRWINSAPSILDGDMDAVSRQFGR